MEELLLRLLTELETIGSDHKELYDSNVREIMGDAIMQGVVRHVSDYEIPEDIGLYTEVGNESVRQALGRYIEEANRVAAQIGLTSFHARLSAFQNSDVRVDPKTAADYEDFFGHTPPDWYDNEGNVMWDRVR